MLGASGEAMAIAVSRAGGLGSFPAAGSTPDQIAAACAAIREASAAPFAVNLFVLDTARPDPVDVRAAMDRLAPWRERFRLPPQALPNQWAQPFDEQFAALLDIAPPVASFTFGVLPPERVQALQARGVFVIGTATSEAEARAWSLAGADAICAQGFEAGGHRGSFLELEPEAAVGTLALTRLIRRAVELPVIAAGGIADGAGVAAALVLGADAAQVGTAYLLCEESLIAPAWRRAIEAAPDDPTRLTRAFSGRWARGVENAFMREMRAWERDVPAYPVQNALTQELRAASARGGSADAMSLWAGQAVRLARPGRAADVTAELWGDARAALGAVARRADGAGEFLA